MSEKFAQEKFKNALNEVFTLKLESGESLNLTLTEVADAKQSGPYTSFSIIFQGPKKILLQQQLYRLLNPKLGEQDIFIVPVAKNDAGFQYQAVFNC